MTTVDIAPRGLQPLHIEVDRDRVTPCRRTRFIKDAKGEIFGKESWEEDYDPAFLAWAASTAAELAARLGAETGQRCAEIARPALIAQGIRGADLKRVLDEVRQEAATAVVAEFEPECREALLRNFGAEIDRGIAAALAPPPPA